MTYRAIVQNGVITLPSEAQVEDGTPVDVIVHPKPARLGDLLEHAGTWQGDDADQVVDLIYRSRSSRQIPGLD